MVWLNHKGLSLIGVLLAASLLGTTAVAVGQLVARSERASRGSRESLVGIMLAREGLELVRALRDTNWFLQRSDNRSWTQGLCDEAEFTLDAERVRRLEGVGDRQQDAVAVAGQPTPYKRYISVDCTDKDISMLVTSHVTWQEGSESERAWTVSERMYDWLK